MSERGVSMSEQKKLTKKICSKCIEEKNSRTDYYLAANNTVNEDGRLFICKECLANLVDMNNVESLINIMRMIDRPFLKSTYDSSLSKQNAFGEYMRMLATRQNREKTYLDSEFGTRFGQYSNKKEMEEFNRTIDLEADGYTESGLKELRKRWGKFDVEDYVFLEDFYNDYAHSYSTDTPAQINLYKNIAKIHLQAEKELSEGNIKTYKDLMDLSSKLHNDGNIKPIQSTGANDDRGLSTYGLWIKEIEKEEPCEYFEERPTYEDFDAYKKYWEKWFIRPFKNIFNISNDFDVEDDD